MTHQANCARLAPRPYREVRHLRAARPPQGEPFDVTVEISDVFRLEDSRDWACAMRIVGLDPEHRAEHGRAFFGVDPMQAIEHALFIAHVELELATEKLGLAFADGGPYVPVTLFRRPGEAGHQA
ncbi:MAG TPA: hypothetical protein PLO65_05915 [Caulobacter sp.]|nr:hypothetical protein [Caulobacter sp.]